MRLAMSSTIFYPKNPLVKRLANLPRLTLERRSVIPSLLRILPSRIAPSKRLSDGPESGKPCLWGIQLRKCQKIVKGLPNLWDKMSWLRRKSQTLKGKKYKKSQKASHRLSHRPSHNQSLPMAYWRRNTNFMDCLRFCWMTTTTTIFWRFWWGRGTQFWLRMTQSRKRSKGSPQCREQHNLDRKSDTYLVCVIFLFQMLDR